MQYDPVPPSQSPSPHRRHRHAKRGDRLRRYGSLPRWVRWSAPMVLAVVAGSIVGVGVAAAIRVPRVDQLDSYVLSQVTRLYDRDGGLLSSYARERRILLAEGDVPEVLAQAVLAAEDHNFYQHGGVDAVGVARAVIANLRAGPRSEGASTLTMQLARGLFLSPKKTWPRKIEEAFLAVELEKTYTKQQILTMYCNLMFVGERNYGMQAASRYYFGKNVDGLTTPEAATLAAIVQRPSVYSPYRNPDGVLTRRNYVLRHMHGLGYLDAEALEQAVATPLELLDRRLDDHPAAYFAEDVRQALVERFGSDAVLEHGLEVRTTLDPDMQRAAREALRRGLVRLDRGKGWRGPIGRLEPPELEARQRDSLPTDMSDGRWAQGVVLALTQGGAEVLVGDRTYRLSEEGTAWTRRRPDQLFQPGDLAWFSREAADDAEEGDEPTLRLEQQPEMQGAALILESGRGAVRAMVGGWDFDQTKFNRATQARRQVGSAFKPFVYGAALEAGFTPGDTLLDAPVAFRGATVDAPYLPRNYTRTFSGILTLQRALEQSINVPAVKLLDLVGVQTVIDYAQRLGITAPLPPYPSLALGSADIIPMEMAAAYAAIANEGAYVKPYLIEWVRDPNGNELERYRPDVRQATASANAAVLRHMMEGVITRGTAQRARALPVSLAGKTGTTDEYTDAWFIGFTPQYTILTWVGYDAKRTLGRGMTGSSAALPIWIDIVNAGLEEGWIEDGGAFSTSSGVVLAEVDARSGLVPGPGTGTVVELAFVAGSEPTRNVDPSAARVFSLPWYQQMPFYLPKQGEQMPGAGGVEEDGEMEPDPEPDPEPDLPLVDIR